MSEFAEANSVPIENVCSPEPLRRVVWSPPPGAPRQEAFAEALASYGVRRWQRDIVAPMLTQAFHEVP